MKKILLQAVAITLAWIAAALIIDATISTLHQRKDDTVKGTQLDDTMEGVNDSSANFGNVLAPAIESEMSFATLTTRTRASYGMPLSMRADDNILISLPEREPNDPITLEEFKSIESFFNAVKHALHKSATKDT